jgi:ubiquinone/menaquinone biosynthesis C-methylase UbiE
MKMKAEELKLVVKEKYGKIALDNSTENSCCGSSSCCGPGVDYTVFSENYENKEGYNPEADMNLGCGIPTDFAQIKAGDHILDLGSGAGNDCFVARALVGEEGRVTGIDFTEQMVSKAIDNCKRLGYRNIEFVRGDIEEMPFSNDSFDVVISNCVLNLVPDKTKAFSEIYRVLKPGGHFCVSDVVIRGSLPDKLREDAEMYAGCVSGASSMDVYLQIVEQTGFRNINVNKQKEIRLPETLLSKYNDENEIVAPADSGIFSITVSAEKPV